MDRQRACQKAKSKAMSRKLRRSDKWLLWAGGISILTAALFPLLTSRSVETFPSDGQLWSRSIRIGGWIWPTPWRSELDVDWGRGIRSIKRTHRLTGEAQYRWEREEQWYTVLPSGQGIEIDYQKGVEPRAIP